jgi:hypothetical protein
VVRFPGYDKKGEGIDNNGEKTSKWKNYPSLREEDNSYSLRPLANIVTNPGVCAIVAENADGNAVWF